MRDTKKILRKAVYDALGSLTYNSASVPVYDEKTPQGNTANMFVILSTQSETAVERNSTAFITQSSIDLEIWHKTSYEVSKDGIDDVYEDIIDTIFPSIGSLGITAPSGFQFQEGFRESSVTQSVQLSETESVLLTRMKLTFLITEQ